MEDANRELEDMKKQLHRVEQKLHIFEELAGQDNDCFPWSNSWLCSWPSASYQSNGR